MTTAPDFDAVLFDLDGVLIDSEPVAARALQAGARRYGFEVPDEAMPLFTGLTGHVAFAIAVERFAGGRVDAVTLRAACDRIYEDWLPHVPAMPGAPELVRMLRAGGRLLGLATSSRRRHAETALTALGVRNAFAVVVGAEDVQRTKPDPEPWLVAARTLGVDPARCVVIEDSILGVRSGVAAGCLVLGYPSSFPPVELLEAGAHRVFASHAEIGAYLGG